MNANDRETVQLLTIRELHCIGFLHFRTWLQFRNVREMIEQSSKLNWAINSFAIIRRIALIAHCQRLHSKLNCKCPR